MIFIISVLVILASLYSLYPIRKRKELDVYTAVLSIFENQSNALIDVCVQQSDAVDTVLESKITRNQYNNMLEVTYKDVINHIPEYIKNEVLKFLSVDEVQKMVLYKINLAYMEKYANIVIPEDDLFEYDDSKSIKDTEMSMFPKTQEFNIQ